MSSVAMFRAEISRRIHFTPSTDHKPGVRDRRGLHLVPDVRSSAIRYRSMPADLDKVVGVTRDLERVPPKQRAMLLRSSLTRKVRELRPADPSRYCLAAPPTSSRTSRSLSPSYYRDDYATTMSFPPSSTQSTARSISPASTGSLPSPAAYMQQSPVLQYYSGSVSPSHIQTSYSQASFQSSTSPSYPVPSVRSARNSLYDNVTESPSNRNSAAALPSINVTLTPTQADTPLFSPTTPLTANVAAIRAEPKLLRPSTRRQASVADDGSDDDDDDDEFDKLVEINIRELVVGASTENVAPALERRSASSSSSSALVVEERSFPAFPAFPAAPTVRAASSSPRLHDRRIEQTTSSQQRPQPGADCSTRANEWPQTSTLDKFSVVQSGSLKTESFRSSDAEWRQQMRSQDRDKTIEEQEDELSK